LFHQPKGNKFPQTAGVQRSGESNNSTTQQRNGSTTQRIHYLCTMFQIIEILGTIAFAISGALTAMNKRLDPFGVFIIAFVTAVGGGTLRDVMLGQRPAWMVNVDYVYLIVVGFGLAVLFRKKFDRFRISLFLFDTIGLGVFTLIGLQKGIDGGLHPVICVALGTMTACFGGVIRDILCNEIPVIFRREIYATICIAGGIVYFTLRALNLHHDALYVATALVMIVLRLMAVHYRWSLSPLGRK
jgi:uncharacterized membrane protein YeiH